MRAEVFTSFGYLLTGLVIGEVKAGTVRASVFAPADYWPQRLSDLFCRHKLSGQALMAHLTTIALTALYPQGCLSGCFGLPMRPIPRSPMLTALRRSTGF